MEFLPNFVDCREFLNADLIAAGLSPFAPETQNIRAGRTLLERFHELAKHRESFGFETTLSGKTYHRLISSLIADGYRTEAFFLWLPNADLAVKRVELRVRQRGHSIPEVDIRRRFISSLRNFFQLYGPLFDAWRLYDASKYPPTLIAEEIDERIDVVDPELYRVIRASLSSQS